MSNFQVSYGQIEPETSFANRKELETWLSTAKRSFEDAKVAI